MYRTTRLLPLISVLIILTLMVGCAGPQPPAAGDTEAVVGEAVDTPAPEEAEEPEEPELSGELPPLAPEAEGIEYTDVPELAYEGTITFYAQAYTPIEPTANTPAPPRYLNRIIAEYERLHPEITIELVPPLASGTDYITWVRTQAAGAQLPDIVWVQATDVNDRLPRGMFLPLTEAFEEPNPYVPEGQPGNERWLDSFAGFVMDFVRATDGNFYQINGDYVGTAIFYNQDMFTEAGLDPENPPTTWSEFIAAHEALAEAGFQPFAFPMGPSAYIWSWWHRVGATQFYENMFDEMNVDDNEFRLSTYARARNYALEIWDPMDPRFQETFRILKDWSAYWVPGTLSMSIDDTYRMFVTGEVAMYWNGSWAVPQTLNNTEIDFEWATFGIPSFDEETTEFHEGIPAPMIGGPSAAFQYSVSSEQANASMTAEKLEATVDFLKFLTAPQNAGPMVNDLGSFIPTIQGTEPLPSLGALIEDMSNTETMGFYELTTEEGQTNQRYLQEFIGDQTDMEEYMTKVKPLMMEAAAQLAQENDWDWETPPVIE